MNRVIMTLGFLMPLEVLWSRSRQFSNGIAFEADSISAIIVFLIFVLILLTFLVLFMWRCFWWFRRQTNWRSPAIVGFFLALTIGVIIAPSPFPRFVDGLKHAVEDKLDRERLISLAAQLRQVDADDNPNRLGLSDHQRGGAPELIAKIEKVKGLYPEAFKMSSFPPRFWISHDYVTFIYGGALSGHWGYSVVEKDKCPFKPSPALIACTKVFDNVWVFEMD